MSLRSLRKGASRVYGPRGGISAFLREGFGLAGEFKVTALAVQRTEAGTDVS